MVLGAYAVVARDHSTRRVTDRASESEQVPVESSGTDTANPVIDTASAALEVNTLVPLTIVTVIADTLSLGVEVSVGEAGVRRDALSGRRVERVATHALAEAGGVAEGVGGAVGAFSADESQR